MAFWQPSHPASSSHVSTEVVGTATAPPRGPVDAFWSAVAGRGQANTGGGVEVSGTLGKPMTLPLQRAVPAQQCRAVPAIE